MPVQPWSSWVVGTIFVGLAGASLWRSPSQAPSIAGLVLLGVAAAVAVLTSRVQATVSSMSLVVQNHVRRHRIEVASITRVSVESTSTPMTMARSWPILALQADDKKVRVAASTGRRQASVDELVRMIQEQAPGVTIEPAVLDAFS